jgi:hypothetical protein
VVLFACERIPAMGAPAAAWWNPPLRNALNAAHRGVSARSYFVAAQQDPPGGRRKIIEN